MINIRNLQKKDASQVALLISQLTKNIIEPENLVKRIKQLSNTCHWQYLVAEKDGKVVGFAGLAWYSIPSKGLIAWFEEVVVDSQHRNQGIGKTLIEVLVNLARQKKIKQIKLTTTPLALNLYEKFGFIKKNQEYLVKNM